MHIAPILLLAAMASTPAVAQSPAQPVPRATYLGIMDTEFGKMDANGDKIVTRAEIEQLQRAAALTQAARNQAMFAQLDSDKNGQISRAEFARLRISGAAAGRGAADRAARYRQERVDHLGRISHREARELRPDRHRQGRHRQRRRDESGGHRQIS